MKALIKELKIFMRSLSPEDKINLSDEALGKLYEVYPFNKFEYIISHLIGKKILSLDDYLSIRNRYITRNKYLYLFELAPRTFGETWGQKHLMELIEEFEIPTKEKDAAYVGQYDMLLENIRVEVKASRAVKKKGGDTLVNKALAKDSICSFDMNFQQLKPSCCDIFVWIAVWRDKIDYWVFPSYVIQQPHDGGYFSSVHLSPQHRRNEAKPVSEAEIYEGQIHINNKNYDEFEPYRVSVRQLYDRIKSLMNSTPKDK